VSKQAAVASVVFVDVQTTLLDIQRIGGAQPAPSHPFLRPARMEQSVESGSGVNRVEDQEYTNRFIDVHTKVKALKDRIRQANETNADRRENRLAQEAKEIIDQKPTQS